MDIFALATFALIASITPGPNNLMLAASGMRFGFYKTLPHAFGIGVGMSGVFTLCGLGIGSAMLLVPGMRWVLSLGGSIYLIFLLTKFLRLDTTHPTVKTQASPMTLWQSVAFQFINPKAWVVGVMAVSIFLPSSEWPWYNLIKLIGIFMAVNIVSVSSWITFGRLLQTSFAKPKQRFWIQGGLVGLTLYTIASLWVWCVFEHLFSQ